jgi:hypothetical protein
MVFHQRLKNSVFGRPCLEPVLTVQLFFGHPRAQVHHLDIGLAQDYRLVRHGF